MASFYKRILDCRTLSSNDLMGILEALDLGAYKEIEIVLPLVRQGAGTNPKLVIKHAMVNEPDAYVGFATPYEVDLTQSNGTISWTHVPYFTRFVRWYVTGTLSTAPVVTVDILAKE